MNGGVQMIRDVEKIRHMTDNERRKHQKKSKTNYFISLTIWLFVLLTIWIFRGLLYPFSLFLWVGISIVFLYFMSYEILYSYYYSTDTGYGKNRSIRDANKFSLSSTDKDGLGILFFFVILFGSGIIAQFFGVGMEQSFSLKVETVIFSIPSFIIILIYLREKHNVRILEDYLDFEK